MTTSTSTTIARYAEIARLIWKYRNAGILKSDTLLTNLVADSGDLPEEEGTPEEFAKDLEAMGPAFVKIGQSMSTRPDLISPEYIKALSSMQDDCSPIPFEEVREIVERELGVRLNKAFSFFDEAPLAAASLGQVHRARLRDNTEVVFKVQRPGTEVRVEEDLSILNSIAEKLEAHSDTGRQFGITQWVSELRRSITRELDYETEASNLETMASLTDQYPNLVVPKPIWDLTSRRVLTMEYIAGVKVPDRSGVRLTEEDGTEMASELTRAYLDQMFIHGFVHVDPHPGNILVTDDAKLVILDLGMVTHLSPRMRNKMLTLILAIMDGRGGEAAEHVISMSEPLSDFDQPAAVRAVTQMVSEYSIGSKSVSEGMLMLAMTRKTAECGLRPPPEIILLGKTLLNLEHLASLLAPDLEMESIVKSHLSKVVRHRALDQMKPSSVVSNLLETNELLQKVPRQLSSILDNLSDNKFTVRVDAFDENRFAENLQKIANRVTVGLIVAALIIGAAMLMRIQTEATLWGYPAFAMVFFLIAGALGLGLVISVLWTDRKRNRE